MKNLQEQQWTVQVLTETLILKAIVNHVNLLTTIDVDMQNNSEEQDKMVKY